MGDAVITHGVFVSCSRHGAAKAKLPATRLTQKAGRHDLALVGRRKRILVHAIRDARRDFSATYAFVLDTLSPEGNWASADTWIRFERSLDEPGAFAQQIVAPFKGESPATAFVAELPDNPTPYRALAPFGIEDPNPSSGVRRPSGQASLTLPCCYVRRMPDNRRNSFSIPIP